MIQTQKTTKKMGIRKVEMGRTEFRDKNVWFIVLQMSEWIIISPLPLNKLKISAFAIRDHKNSVIT